MITSNSTTKRSRGMKKKMLKIEFSNGHAPLSNLFHLQTLALKLDADQLLFWQPVPAVSAKDNISPISTLKISIISMINFPISPRKPPFGQADSRSLPSLKVQPALKLRTDSRRALLPLSNAI